MGALASGLITASYTTWGDTTCWPAGACLGELAFDLDVDLRCT